MSLSKRAVYNLDYLGDDLNTVAAAYAFINHVKCGGTFGPVGANWFNGTRYWHQSVDSNGWPNVAGLGSSDQFGGGFYVPKSSDFAGPYVLAWDGDGTIQFNVGTWTETSLTGAVRNSNGNWSNTGGSTSVRIVLTMSGSTQRIPWRCNASGRGSGNSSQNLTNLRFYRLADETDFLAGKIYRSAWKQQIIDLNPGVIRFMNWFGGNAADTGLVMKYSQTRPATYATWGSGGCFVDPNNPKYGVGTQPGTPNAIVVAAVTGTPASMQTGEVCTFFLQDAVVRSGALSITNIVDKGAGIAEVTTSTNHGFNIGDRIIHYSKSNMPGMDLKVAAVTSTPTATTYQIAVDVSAMGSWSGTGACTSYITLKVGSGNDRVEYPVCTPDGVSSIGLFGSVSKNPLDIMKANQYKTFIFDKRCVAAQGVTGAWIGVALDNASSFMLSGPPLSVMAALINELKAQGWYNPIDMWTNIPYASLTSQDADYSAAESIPIKATQELLGYLPSEINLHIEYSNETWNYNNWPSGIGGTSFWQGIWCTRFGYLRNNAQGLASIDKGSGTTLRALMAMYDIKQNVADSRVKYLMVGQGTLGVTGHNLTRISGNSQVTTDSFFLSLGISNPIDYFDAWASGCYIDGQATSSATCTISNGNGVSAGVITKAAHGLVVGLPVTFTTTGTLPTGLSPYSGLPSLTNVYYVASVPTANTFTVSATLGGAEVMTSSAGSGTHTMAYGFSTNRAIFGEIYNAASTEAQKAVARNGFVSALLGTAAGGESINYYGSTRVPDYATNVALKGKPVANYEGGWDLSPTGTYATFLTDCQYNYEWAWAWLTYLNAVNSQSNAYWPAIYIQTNQQWSHSYPDTYSGGVEGANFSAAWRVTSLFDRNKRRFKVVAS